MTLAYPATLQRRPRRHSSSALVSALRAPEGFVRGMGRNPWRPLPDGMVEVWSNGRTFTISRTEAHNRFGCDCLPGKTPSATPPGTDMARLGHVPHAGIRKGSEG